MDLPFQLNLIEMDIQDMNFEDESFNYVVVTCVFCSVSNPINGLKEIRRVCKPNVEILLFEHMRSENGVTGKMMDIIKPLTLKLW